jgi:hypothetical protein
VPRGRSTLCLPAGERGEHAEHAEACKPGEGTARLPTDFARILFTLSRKGSQRLSRGLSPVANTCMHVRNRMSPTLEPATPGDISGPLA